jgi:hypothetical protein
MTETERGAPVAGTVEERKDQERKVWRSAFLISVGLHLLLFLLWPSGGGPVSPFAAAGPQERDDLAAEGVMQALALRSAPPDPIQPPPMPIIEADLPDPVEVEPDATPEVDLTEPDLPEPGRGASEGSDPEDADPAGIPGADGGGDAGTSDEGRFRVVPPSPRGMIIPPTHNSLRGQEIEVWVFVDERGRVVPDSTRLEPPTSNRGFNEQLMREAAQWVFQPARRGDEAVAAWFPYTISME